MRTVLHRADASGGLHAVDPLAQLQIHQHDIHSGRLGQGLLAGRVMGQGATLRDIPGTLFLGGGVPVAVDGTSVAGIGVGGAPSGDLDEKYAKAGLATLK
ncbi:heme-binding protein [Lentzea californiensis]|uniref:heme-binding protein n=1 Tax=Lentzea californiensis TaxID=438851 RepID=UPI0035563279